MSGAQDTEALAAELCKCGLPAGHYHADMDPGERMRVHSKWSQGMLASGCSVGPGCQELPLLALMW